MKKPLGCSLLSLHLVAAACAALYLQVAARPPAKEEWVENIPTMEAVLIDDTVVPALPGAGDEPLPVAKSSQSAEEPIPVMPIPLPKMNPGDQSALSNSETSRLATLDLNTRKETIQKLDITLDDLSGPLRTEGAVGAHPTRALPDGGGADFSELNRTNK